MTNADVILHNGEAYTITTVDDDLYRAQTIQALLHCANYTHAKHIKGCEGCRQVCCDVLHCACCRASGKEIAFHIPIISVEDFREQYK